MRNKTLVKRNIKRPYDGEKSRGDRAVASRTREKILLPIEGLLDHTGGCRIVTFIALIFTFASPSPSLSYSLSLLSLSRTRARLSSFARLSLFRGAAEKSIVPAISMHESQKGRAIVSLFFESILLGAD